MTWNFPLKPGQLEIKASIVNMFSRILVLQVLFCFILAEEASKNQCVKTILEGAIPPHECGCNAGTKSLGEVDAKCTESCKSASKETAQCCENKCITESAMVDGKINKEALAEYFVPHGSSTNLEKITRCERFVEANPTDEMLCGIPKNYANVITCTAWLILAECEKVKETEKCSSLKNLAESCVKVLENTVPTKH